MAPAERGDGMPYRMQDGSLLLRIKAIPNAGRSEIVGVRAGELVIKLQVPALEGRANRELVRLLSRRLKVPRSSVVMLAGQTSQHKRLQVPSEASGALHALCKPAG